MVTSSVRPGTEDEWHSLFDATNGPHVAVSALPGVDLEPIMGLPGSSTSSGPFPGVQSSIRYRGKEVALYVEARSIERSAVDSPAILSGRWVLPRAIVLERKVARRLAVRPGERVHLTASGGRLPLLVAGIAETTVTDRYPGSTRIGYVLPDTLADIAPNDRVHSETLLIRLDDPSAAGAFAKWIRAEYPGAQAAVEDWKSLRSGSSSK